MMKNVFVVAGLLVALSLGLSSIVRAEDDYMKFGVRMRAIYVAPSESVDSRVDTVLGGKTTVSDNIIPELDLEYFFLKNVSTELILGVTRHDIKAGNQYVGSTWLLPPTLTVKYHPLAGDTISPYVGVGLNATIPFHSKLNADPNFKLDNTIGWAAQAGVDVKIKDNLYFNLDYKYVNVNSKISVPAVSTSTKFKLDLNPNLIGIGVGYRF